MPRGRAGRGAVLPAGTASRYGAIRTVARTQYDAVATGDHQGLAAGSTEQQPAHSVRRLLVARGYSKAPHARNSNGPFNTNSPTRTAALVSRTLAVVAQTFICSPRFVTPAGRTLVFANAVSAIRRVHALLKSLALPVHALHAQQQQRQRLKVRHYVYGSHAYGSHAYGSHAYGPGMHGPRTCAGT